MKIFSSLFLALLSTTSAFASSHTPEVYCVSDDSLVSVRIFSESADGSRKSLNYRLAKEDEVLVDQSFIVDQIDETAGSVIYTTDTMDLVVNTEAKLHDDFLRSAILSLKKASFGLTVPLVCR